MNSLTAYNAETRSASPLQGDFSARSIASQLRQTLSNAVAGFNGPFSSLSEIGITKTESNGNLKLDSVRLDKILVENFDQIAGLFAQVGFPVTTAFRTFQPATKLQSAATGQCQPAGQQGQLLGAVAAFPLDIDADNDNFSIKVNGVDSASISPTQGNYANGDALAAEYSPESMVTARWPRRG